MVRGLPSRDDAPRRRRAAWAISAVLHAAALAWWASLPGPEPRPPDAPSPWAAVELIELLPAPTAPTPSTEPSLPPTPEPSEPDEPTAVEPDRTPPTTKTPRPRRTEPPEAGPETPSSEEPSSSSTPGALALSGLRGGSRPDSARAIARPSLPPPRVDGGHVFTEVGGMGTEEPSTSHDGQPRSLAEAGFRRTRGGKMVYTDRRSGFKATLLPDGRLKFRITVTPSSMPGMSEVIRAAQGQELFQQQKKRLLDATFDLRLAMAIDFARDKIDRRLKSLYRDLLDRWSDGSTSEAERRAALFQRWDECEEGLPVTLKGFEGVDSSELDQVRRAAGTEARETIERFIRRHLPAGSSQAFTEDELRRFNAGRRSRARFDPYR